MASDVKTEQDDFFDPGAAQFGNFINYYEFNPPINRLSLFEEKFTDIFSHQQSVVCLDVGCNTGVRAVVKLYFKYCIFNILFKLLRIVRFFYTLFIK